MSRLTVSGGVSCWLSQLKVGEKISWGYAIALGIATLGTIVGIVMGEHYKQQAWIRKEQAHQETELLQRLQTELLQARRHQQQFIPLVTQPTALQTEYARFLDRATATKQTWVSISFFATQANLGYAHPIDMSHAQEILHFLLAYEKVSDDYFQAVGTLMQQLEAAQLNSPTQITAVQQQLMVFSKGDLARKFDRVSDELVHLVARSHQDDLIAEAKILQAGTLRLWIITSSLLMSLAIAALLTSYTNRAIPRRKLPQPLPNQ